MSDKPMPRPPKPTPALVASKTSAPVKVPVVTDITPEQLAQAAAFGEARDGRVWVTDGADSYDVGPARGDDPVAPYCKAYYELLAAIERFHARLSSAELSVAVIDETAASLSTQLATPVVVGDLSAARARLDAVLTEANELRERIQAERAQAREEAQSFRESLVEQAEALSSKPESAVHWKSDTALMRELFESWQEAQRSRARLPKDVEKSLWKRFTVARSHFEKTRKHHFAELDKSNSDVKTRKETLVARAETLAESTDWETAGREWRDLMDQWKAAGRGRRSVDDALWARFHSAQERFFEARRAAAGARDEALSGNVEAKEAAVADAEGLLPVTDISHAKQTLRALQDRFDSAGEVPRADAARLTKRMAAVERAIREADEKQWTARNPEIEARATGAAQQLREAIAELEEQIEGARARKDTKTVKQLEESLTTRQEWLAQVEGVVN